jgi:hypothetical protein
MLVCLLCVIIFLAIESNDECAEEGEVSEYKEEENQGQANQGKPSILDAYLLLFIYLHVFLQVYQSACFSYIAIVLVAIIVGLAPQLKLLSSIVMTPLNTYSIPL